MDSGSDVRERLLDAMEDRTLEIPVGEVVREGRRRRSVRARRLAAIAAILVVGVATTRSLGGGATVAGFAVVDVDGREVIGIVEPSVSMEPTIRAGQIVAVDVHAYDERGPARGDIVALTYGLDPECSGVMLKRVVGLGGDTVEERNGRMFVNGEPVKGPLDESDGGVPGSLGPWVVEPGHLFVVGDNLDSSNDSRFEDGLGQVNVERVIGLADLSIVLDRADVPAPPACSVEVPGSAVGALA